MNLPLLFGAILAGGVTIAYGHRNVTSAFASAGSSTSTPTSSTPAVSSTAGGNPLPGVVRWERTDQGVDAAAAPGSAVNALFSGTVSAIVPNWYAGQPALVVDSPGLPGGATGIYYAEQLIPNVKVGDTVQADQQIGTVASTGTGLELGLWKDGRTLAQATTGYAEGQVTRAGQLMHQLLQSAGVKL